MTNYTVLRMSEEGWKEVNKHTLLSTALGTASNFRSYKIIGFNKILITKKNSSYGLCEVLNQSI
jgi:hypothetical protein